MLNPVLNPKNPLKITKTQKNLPVRLGLRMGVPAPQTGGFGQIFDNRGDFG